MLILLAAAFLLLAFLFFVYSFAKTDGDFALSWRPPTPRSAIEDKVVWISGASQNIGKALAQEYARLGAKVIISARREAELEQVKASLKGKHAPHDVVVLPADITLGVKDLRKYVDEAEAAFGGAGIDIMVHNAAAGRPVGPAVDYPDDMLQNTFDVNVLGTIRLTQQVLPGMLRRGTGQFVVVSSVAGKVPSPGQTVYSASKHAVNGYFHSLRSEVLAQGIKVTVACPGPIDTPRPSQPGEKKLEKRLPVPRCAELIVKAGAYELGEAWLCNQPILTFMYFMQYCPFIGFFVINKLGPKRLKSYKEGGSGYSMSDLLKKSS